jgi:2-polyprenyl-3-methyl-5-hydroxy-6-metoxy-1,4-benzoquinol methylase
MSIDFEGIKEGQRRMWASGDYPDIARRIVGAAEMVIERAQPTMGMSLLDVATGDGNVAIGAAAAGASVTGLDITPTLLEAAGERARGRRGRAFRRGRRRGAAVRGRIV